MSLPRIELVSPEATKLNRDSVVTVKRINISGSKDLLITFLLKRSWAINAAIKASSVVLTAVRKIIKLNITLDKKSGIPFNLLKIKIKLSPKKKEYVTSWP